jgi:hypothetical protein
VISSFVASVTCRTLDVMGGGRVVLLAVTVAACAGDEPGGLIAAQQPDGGAAELIEPQAGEYLEQVMADTCSGSTSHSEAAFAIELGDATVAFTGQRGGTTLTCERTGGRFGCPRKLWVTEHPGYDAISYIETYVHGAWISEARYERSSELVSWCEGDDCERLELGACRSESLGVGTLTVGTP